MELLDALKHIVDSSTQLSTWGLAVLAGSVAAILGTSYRRPRSLGWRLPFLLFFPGWACLGFSLHLGNTISGRYLAAVMVHRSHLRTIAVRINDDYSSQQGWFLGSLIFFGAWLALYLIYWVFFQETTKEQA